MDERTEALEVKVAYLEHQIAQLDELVRELFGTVDGLRDELRRVREERGEADDGDSFDLVAERPPHY